MSSLTSTRFTASSAKNPCPVCGRTKDGDCRLTGDGRTFCHSYQHYKPGETLRGADGQEWACVGNTTDGAGWGIFKVHEPLEKRERWQKPPRPKSEKFYYYPDRNGNPLVRVKRIDRGDGTKQFYQERWDGHTWQPGLGDLDRSLIPIYRYRDVKAAIARGEPILWVEGERVADLLWEIGLPATTSLGGSGGFTKYGDYSQDVAGASLVICPDRDPKGIAYAEQVARYFGATQWIYAGDAAQWDNPGDGYDLADWINDLRSQGLDDAAIKARILGAIGDQRKNLRSCPKDSSDNTKQKDKDGAAFLEQAVNSLYSEGKYVTLNQELYKWVGTHYQIIPDSQELARIAEYCRGRKFTPSTIKNILELQKLATGITTDQVNPPGYLNCTNGVLRWWWDGDKLRTELLPHNPDLIFIDPPVVEYNPDADPTSLNRLLECLEPQPREILIRTLACALDLPAVRKRKARTPRALLLYGTGANGKDTLRTAVFRLFGGRGCTAVSLSDFQAYDGGRKFGLADLEHARVNWPSETVPVGKLDKIESLKQVTTGDPISIERKGIQERRLIPKAVLLFNCNKPPDMTAATEAIRSRYSIIPFNKTFKSNPDIARGELPADPRFKDDPVFIDREILPALLNLLLAKLQVVAVDGIDYSPVADQIDELRRRSSHLVQFCEDVGLTEDPDGMVSVNELWNKLEAWYIANNYLTIEQGPRGGQKRHWEHPSGGDRCVTAPHQVLQRFTEIFPKVRRKTWRNRVEGQDRVITYLHGIKFLPEIEKIGSPGSPCTNKNAANPVIEPQKNGDPMMLVRVTVGSPGSPGSPQDSPPQQNGDHWEPSLYNVPAQGHQSNSPMNKGSGDQTKQITSQTPINTDSQGGTLLGTFSDNVPKTSLLCPADNIQNVPPPEVPNGAASGKANPHEGDIRNIRDVFSDGLSGCTMASPRKLSDNQGECQSAIPKSKDPGQMEQWPDRPDKPQKITSQVSQDRTDHVTSPDKETDYLSDEEVRILSQFLILSVAEGPDEVRENCRLLGQMPQPQKDQIWAAIPKEIKRQIREILSSPTENSHAKPD